MWLSAFIEVLIKCQGNTERAELMIPKKGAMAGEGIREEVTFCCIMQTK